MKQFYIISLVYNQHLKKNMRDVVTAKDKNDALFLASDKYLTLGFRIVNQKILELTKVAFNN